MWIATTVLLLIALVWLQVRWQRRHAALTRQLSASEDAYRTLERHQQVSLHKRAEQDTMLNSMAEGVLLLDSDRRVQWMNNSLRRLCNVTRDVAGETIISAFPLPELAEFVAGLGSGGEPMERELTLPGIEGRILQINAATVRDQHLGKEGTILVFHDLTRLKELENTRQEFVANVSHELRTPLALIKGYVETLLDGAKNDPEQTTRFLQIIDKHTDRLTFLIDDLLTISRLESGQAVMNLQHVVLHEAADAVIEELLSRADEGKTVVENVIPLDLVSRADAERLHQVFFNLVENAIKYGRKNGHVTVGGQTMNDNTIELWVRDDGPGIRPEFQERIFERFYRIDKARSRETGGTGLGLSIVKHIVQAHGGEVWVRSKVGEGTTFRFTLPVADA